MQRDTAIMVFSWFGGMALAALLFSWDRLPWWLIGIVGCALFVTAVALLLIMISPPTPVVDIWERQRRVMEASDQQAPRSPELNAGTLLYYALTAEELSEQAIDLAGILGRRRGTLESQGPMLAYHAATIRSMLIVQGQRLHSESAEIRRHIAKIPDLQIKLGRQDAKALLDDLTDQAVTVAGGAIATGLPGAAGYREVTRSNLSKANPATGRIDKDPSGKWIKGSNYQAPDLDAVLDQV